MLKDQVPVAGNSADKRRPLIMTSPRERQKKVKELKNPSNAEAIREEFEEYQQEFKFSEKDISVMLEELTSKLNEDHKKDDDPDDKRIPEISFSS